MSRFSLFLFFASLASFANAQIGYQVAVVDQTTGEPKANTDVSVTVTITDNAGGMITTISQSATTNDFGVISLQIGNESTFANTDWTKLPLWIAATVDGVSLGKTQILTVPVAEHAKHSGILTPQILTSKSRWVYGPTDNPIYFREDGTYTCYWNAGENSRSGKYYISGDRVTLYPSTSDPTIEILFYIPERNALYRLWDENIYK